jgi:glycosyltransferase involved in cell wall biosynthesis
VVTDVGAVSELVVHGENGFLVGLERMSTLGEIVRASLHRNWDRETIGARMKTRGWVTCAEQVFEVYRAVQA